MRKNKKAFTLIELIAVLVILAILALIVTPLVMNIVKKAKDSANRRSVDAYGKAVELGVATYLLDNGDYPTDISSLTIEYSGSEVVCNTKVLNEDGSIYLSGCSVNGREVKDSKTDDGYYHYGKAIYYNLSNECLKSNTICDAELIKSDEGVSLDIYVNNNETHKFYVLNDDGENLTLQMDRNLVINSKGKDSSEMYGVEWISESDFFQSNGNYELISGDPTGELGPITALKVIAEKTANWTNIPYINSYSYDNEGYLQDWGNGSVSINNYQSLKINNGKITFIAKNGEENTLEQLLRVRIVSKGELESIGFSNNPSSDTPLWGSNYLDTNGHLQRYLTLTTSFHSPSSLEVVTKEKEGYISHSGPVNGFYRGVRPVIQISKDSIRKYL